MKPHIIVGKHSYGVSKEKIWWDSKSWDYQNNFFQPQLVVGKYCSIGHFVVFFLGGNHRHDWVSTYPFHVGLVNNDTFKTYLNQKIKGYPHSNGDIIIGNDVWIGQGVTIMSGVTIGDGAVIAANTTVIKDVPPYSITGGHPSKHIKYRFTDKQIQDLLKIKWWDFEDSTVDSLLPLILNTDIDKFIDACKIL